MIACGILSLLQLAFLPGFLAARLARLRGATASLPFVFSLSVTANALAVVALTTLGLYTRRAVFTLFIAELALLAVVLRRDLVRPLAWPGPAVSRFLGAYVAGPGGRATGPGAVVRVAALALGGFGVLHALWIYGRPAVEVFTNWDAVASWDRWAVDWFHGVFPRRTYHYPQLVPADLSLTYQFLGGADVKFFARGFMGTFEIATPLALFVLGVYRQSAGAFIGAALAARLLWLFGARAAGTVDSAVACLGLVGFAALWIARDTPDEAERERTVVLGGVIVAAAAITKQGGVWLAAWYAPLALLAIPSAGGTRRQARVVALLATYAVIVAPWYLGKELDIRAGRDLSEIAAVTGDAHAGRGWQGRLSFATSLVTERLDAGPVPGALVATVLILLMLVACGDRLARAVVGLVVLPYVALWMLLWSYDQRNLTIILPLAAFAAGLGLERLLGGSAFGARAVAREAAGGAAAAAGGTATTGAPVRAPGGGRLRLRPLHVVIAFAALLAWLPSRIGDASLRAESLRRQRQIGDAGLNALLYRHAETRGFDGAILTDYQMLTGLPGLGDHFRLGYSNRLAFLDEAAAPDVAYALICSEWSRAEVAARFMRLAEAGRIERVFAYGCWTLFTTCRGPCE